MAERQSILTGRSGPARARAPAPEHDGAVSELNAAALGLLKGEVDRGRAEVDAARADAAAARAEAAAERAKTSDLRTLLAAEADTRAAAQADSAAARAECDGLREQLEAERAARADMKAPLEQAIAAAGAKQPIVIPAYEPPAYELEVTGRDVNERAKRIVLKPIKAVA